MSTLRGADPGTAVFGLHPLADLGHLAALLVFAALMWVMAVRGMRRRLIA